MSESKYEKDITPEIHEFFEEKKVVVFDPLKSLRSTLKKIFFDFGVGLSNIEFFEGPFSEATEMLQEQKPHIIVTPLNFDGRSALELFELHNQVQPERMNCAFFVLSSNNSLSSASMALDHNIDGYVAEPFTKVGIGSHMLKALQKKIEKSPFEREKNRVYQLLSKNDIEGAKELISQVFAMKDVQKDEICYLQGLCCFYEKEFKEAEHFFEKALEFNPDHYRALRGLSDTFIKQGMWRQAYETNKWIIGTYPLNPERIPELIKIAVINKEYEDIFFFHKFFQKLEDRDPIIQKHIAAGLALCGKFLLENGEEDKAMEALKSSAHFSKGALEIMRTVVTTLLEHGVFSKARELLYEVPEEYTNAPQFRLLELDLLSRSTDHVKEALSIGLKLIQEGHGTFQAYDTSIRLCVELKRNPTFIKELVLDATQKYPAEAEHFENYLKES